MSTDHKRPLFAFVVVVVMCALIIANTLRSQAAPGVLRDPDVRIVAGSELVTKPVRAESHAGPREPAAPAVSVRPAVVPSHPQAAPSEAAQHHAAQPQAAQPQAAAAVTSAHSHADQPGSQPAAHPHSTPVVDQPSSTSSGGHQPAGHALGHLLGQHGVAQQLGQGGEGVGQQVAQRLAGLVGGLAHGHDHRGGYEPGPRSHGDDHRGEPGPVSPPVQAPADTVEEPLGAVLTFGGELMSLAAPRDTP